MSKKQRQPSKKTAVADIEAALIRNQGNLSAAARDLGLASVYRLRERVYRTPRLLRAMQDGRANLTDIAESQIVKRLKDGDTWAIGRVLDAFGRDFGWQPPTQRIEIGEDIEVVEDWGDDDPTEEEAPD